MFTGAGKPLVLKLGSSSISERARLVVVGAAEVVCSVCDIRPAVGAGVTAGKMGA